MQIRDGSQTAETGDELGLPQREGSEVSNPTSLHRSQLSRIGQSISDLASDVPYSPEISK